MAILRVCDVSIKDEKPVEAILGIITTSPCQTRRLLAMSSSTKIIIIFINLYQIATIKLSVFCKKHRLLS
jgi:hypothetical protein